ncbi:hypothetical protein ACPPVO_19240 [Dactylosporangium sp. McL0621]|uniref:hypothetical protein n=1 Tax=Dactylosporangium sp. McL0621 TaxID=3415678 RepID=UPI003CF1A35A
MTRGGRIAVLLPLLLAAAAACTKADDGKDVASAGGGATPAATASLSAQEQGLRHARCMREHGVPEADPVVNAAGGVRIGGGYDKSAIDADVLARATEACKPFEVGMSADDLALKVGAAREEARCMRAHGVEEFPDPEPNLEHNVPESVLRDPQYDEAAAACMRHGGQSPAPSR